ncbi:MAG: leucine-rich repeat domain-containing protein [Bacilli bacterium]|nr:leucine-rich repeat domain-containing protein [Bacilli bacterium]
MSEEKKKRNKIIGLSIGICAAILLIVTGTYAYWTITKSQNDPNSIIAACLDITMEEQTGTLTPSKNYPISDADGLADSGFTFTIKNHCPQDIAYVIGLDSVEVDTTGTNGYMLDGSIKVSIDNTTPRIFGELPEIDHIESNDTYTIRKSRKINTAVVPGMKDGVEGTDTHTIKAWTDADAPLSENNKVFGGRVFITGGQYITDDNPIAKPTDESCFTMNGEEIIGYDESCGTSVTIPMYVGENASLQELASGYGLDLYNEEDAPELLPGQLALYQNASTGEFIGGIYLGEDNVVSIKSLDLSQAYNLETIEPSAFSNVPSTEYDLDNYAKYSKSLTSLTFGSNDKRIVFGHNTFANIDVDNLDLYASYVAKIIDNSLEETAMPFGNAKINNLNVYATDEYDKIEVETVEEIINNGSPMIYIGINADNLTFNEGIKYIMGQILMDATIGKLTLPESMIYNITLRAGRPKVIDEVILPDTLENIPEALFSGVNLNKITLPSNLKTIGSEAFRETTLTEIRIPASVTEIGSTAFYDHTKNLTIIFEGRSNLDGLTLGTSWDYSHNTTTTIEYD